MSPRRFWEAGEKHPPIDSLVLPRPLAWVTVGDDETVCLLNGYTAACYTPPTLYFASSSLPPTYVDSIAKTGKCTVSIATRREMSAMQKAFPSKKRYDLEALGLKQADKRDDYPRAISGSPIQMYCTLNQLVDLNSDSVMLLTIEKFVVDGTVLSDATEAMRARSITAKIDAQLVAAVTGVGDILNVMTDLRSMPRPVPQQGDGSWTSTSFEQKIQEPIQTRQYESFEWNFRIDGRSCPLGFNPTTSLIMPSPIGWISTYSKSGVTHLAPYSFFLDVNRVDFMVAFSAYAGNGIKDAHKDAEETGYFCCNLCSQEMAEQMNLCAAPIPREESEFELAKIEHEPAKLVKAPVVSGSPVQLECEYVKTVEDVGDFCIVIGRVKGVSVMIAVLSGDDVDVSKLRPITRLGYMDEYGVHC